ncbi:MAG: hypothetical protein Q9167_002998 [Letrouitia subvulpina]
MRFLLASSLILLPLALCHASLPASHHEFLKRQGCTSAQSECASNPNGCADFICSNCKGIDTQIDQCCNKPGSDLTILQCIADIDTSGTGGGSSGTGGSGGSDTTSNFFPNSDSTTAGGAGAASASASASDSFGSSTGSITASASLPSFTGGSSGGGRACSSFESILDRCAGATPGFEDIVGFSSSASCLCYSRSNFRPSIFDNYWASCLDFVSTASPSFYASLNDDGSIPTTPCASIGDVRSRPSGVVGGPEGSNSSPSETPSTGEVGGPQPGGSPSASGNSPTQAPTGGCGQLEVRVLR